MNDVCNHGIPLMLECFLCEQAIARHALREREAAQREADRRIVEFHQAAYGPSPEDAWADEPKDVCKRCGAPHVSHMRTPDDDLCPECRFSR